MTTSDKIAEKLKSLPQERQHEVLRFVEALTRFPKASNTPGSPRGLWAEFRVDITETDIDDARNSLWSGFAQDTSL